MGGHGHDAKHDAKHDAPAAPEGEVAGLRTSYVGVSSPFLMDVKKGLFYGGVFSAGTSLMRGYKIERAAVPKNLFVNPDAVWGNAKTYFKTGAPAIVGTLTAFLLLRGSFERSKREWNGTFKHVAVPLTLVALPSVAYAVVKKAPPPEAAGVGLIFCLLTHSYDRMVNLQHYNGWLGKPT